jgi:D-amino acid aminotransferase
MTTEETARISPLDRGLTLGDGIFETVLAQNGSPVFLESHMARLRSGLTALGFEIKKLSALFDKIQGGAITRLIEKNGLAKTTARVRITITRGATKGGLSAVTGSAPTTLITAAPVDLEKIREKTENGIRAVTVKDIRPALPGVKTTNFMPNILAACRARESGAGEAFFLGADNRTVLEGTTSNVFIVKDRQLVTTPAAQKPQGPGALAGVVRQKIIDLAKKNNLAVREDWFTTDDLYHADEVFITNSISGLVPVIKADAATINNNKPGEITRLLQKKYREKITGKK